MSTHDRSSSQAEKDSHAPPSPAADSEQSASTSKQKKKLPPFLDHFNARDLKILFRCSVAFWVASLFLFINPILQSFGTATFFSCIAVLFLPPNGVVMVFLLGGFTELLGMALGWVWGVIAQKAALATRPASETNARLQLLVQQAQSTSTPVNELVLNGFMLDTRVTVTYFCMIGLFVYLMARLRQKVPKLAFTAIFAWIISDVWLTTGPLLPAFNGTVPKVLIIPAAASLAVSLACSLLIFPESTSHLTLFGMHKLVTAMEGSIRLTKAGLAQYPLQDAESLQALKGGLIGGWAQLEPAIGFLPLDLSFGNWNAEDIVALHQPLRQLLLQTISLLEFQINTCRSRDKYDKIENDSPDRHGKHQILQSLNMLANMRQPGVSESVSESYRALSLTSDPLFQAVLEAYAALTDSIQQNNSRRWFGGLSAEEHHQMRQRHESALEKLVEERRRYPSTASKALLDSHAHLFNVAGKFQDSALSLPKLTGLLMGFNFEDKIVRVAETLERPLAQVVLLETERTTRRLWFPAGVRKFFQWVFGRTSTPVLHLPTSEDFPEVDKEALKEMQDKLKDTSRPVKRRSKTSAMILGFAHWISNDEGIYALRVLIGTIAVSVIAVTGETAGFFYREKGLWAVIMAQTGLLLHFSDFTFALMMRVLGTVAGGIVGMLGWYIGSANGPGSPYGMAAVMAVLAPIVMWARLYAPPQHLPTAIIFGATVTLVIGYSWIDTHNPSYGDPGVGYTVFWRRTVLVLIGFFVGFLVSLFPWPSSQSRFVARTMAQVLHAEADHYALLLSEWKHLEDERRLVPAIGSTAMHLAQTLAGLNGPIEKLKYEFSSSPFDEASCAKIKMLEELINQCVASLHIRASLLPEHLRDRLAKVVGLLDHRTIGNVMVVLAVIEQSLKTGDPLPSRLPTPLLKGSLEYGDGAHIDSLTKDLLSDEAYRGYCVAMSAYLGFLSAIDELVLVLKEILGESHHVPADLDFE